jgi:4-alpha-glucanotransferase
MSTTKIGTTEKHDSPIHTESDGTKLLRHVTNAVVYTGTHDNPIARGWFEELPDYQRQDFMNLGREARMNFASQQ